MRLLILYVDAWPYRLRKLLPSSLRKAVARLTPVYGYTDCFKVSLLSGGFPIEHGYWVAYTFSENPQPMPLPRSLSHIIDKGGLIQKATRFLLNKFTHIHMIHLKAASHIKLSPFSPEASIEVINSFLEQSGVYTIFSLAQRLGLSYSVLEDRFYGHDLALLYRHFIEQAKQHDIIFIYIDEPDFWGHRYGVHSGKYLGLLEWLSKIIGKFIEAAKLTGSEYIVFSDHGMASVSRFLNIYDLFTRDERYGRDYVVGIDATFLRIFYIDREEAEKSRVLAQIKSLLSSHAILLDREAREKYKLPPDRRYGDEVYALNEGVVFYPNFFSWLKPYGMHAYNPQRDWQKGVVASSPRIPLEKNSYSVKDLHRLILEAIKTL